MPYSRKHYLAVLEESKKELEGTDAAEKARLCGFEFEETEEGPRMFFISLGVQYEIDPVTWEIRRVAGGRVMPLQMRIVTLHYIKRAAGVPLKGELIPLTKFPELMNYGPVIRRRSENILSRCFADNPELFFPALEKLGGERINMGDAAGRFHQLPLLPVVVVVHESEPGLPGEAIVMMDASAPEMMHLEDLVVLAELLSHKLASVAAGD